ncbi:MAG: ornithine cyclodeaminase [Prevotella sp.]|jgi:ornithine cyclodeaminase|nr:ornithine cyclodeaminase [Prevotella sp.]
MKTDKIAIIQQEQISSLNISPTECIKWVEEGFKMKDLAQMPPKPSVHPQGEDFMTTMPCLLPEQNGHKRFGIKVVNRIEGQIPALSSVIYLYDAKTGHLLAMMDGDWITAMRTGAVATLAARLFQKKGVDTYSIMGLGNIARATAMCLIADHQDKSITIRLLRYKDQAEQFIERFGYATNVNFEIIDDKKEFISKADVVFSCVTVATELLFPDDALFKKGITVIPVHVRGFQNCDLFFDKVFGDDTGQIRNWKYFPKFRQYDEIHHVLLGENPGRTNQDERIISYNYGLGLHDIVYASKIYDLINVEECDSFFFSIQDKKLWV